MGFASVEARTDSLSAKHPFGDRHPSRPLQRLPLQILAASLMID
jgi:hypothetical protein